MDNKDLEKIAQELIRSIDNAIDSFNDSTPKIQQKIYEDVVLIIKDLDIKDGRIVNNAKNLKLITKLNATIEKAVINDDYISKTKEFINAFTAASNIQKKYFNQIKKGFEPSERIEIIKKLAVENTIDSLLEAGIEVNLTTPIKQLIEQNIVSGGKFTDLSNIVRDFIVGDESKEGRLERYSKQITTDALNQYSANYNSIVSEDLGMKWFMYVGSNLETTREFCNHLTQKRYVHESELPEVIKGKIDGHQVKVYKKTGLPYGMVPGTTIFNFKTFRGGYNCGHQLYGIPESLVPIAIRKRFEKLQAFKSFNSKNYNLKESYFDYSSGGFFVVHKGHEKSALSINKLPAKILADRGYQVELIDESISTKSGDAIVNSVLYEFKVIANASNIVNRLSNEIKRASGKSDRVMILINQNYSEKELKSGMIYGANKTTVTEIHILDKEGNIRVFKVSELLKR